MPLCSGLLHLGTTCPLAYGEYRHQDRVRVNSIYEVLEAACGLAYADIDIKVDKKLESPPGGGTPACVKQTLEAGLRQAGRRITERGSSIEIGLCWGMRWTHIAQVGDGFRLKLVVLSQWGGSPCGEGGGGGHREAVCLARVSSMNSVSSGMPYTRWLAAQSEPLR